MRNKDNEFNASYMGDIHYLRNIPDQYAVIRGVVYSNKTAEDWVAIEKILHREWHLFLGDEQRITSPNPTVTNGGRMYWWDNPDKRNARTSRSYIGEK